jgi:hypothetical protein
MIIRNCYHIFGYNVPAGFTCIHRVSSLFLVDVKAEGRPVHLIIREVLSNTCLHICFRDF